MNLTQEELDIVNQLLHGLRPKQIQGVLAISSRTYVRRRKEILRKLDARNDFQIGMRLEQCRRVQSEMLQ